MEKLLEIRTMLSHIHHCTGYLASDHIINLLQNINGYLDRDLQQMLDAIDSFLSLPRKKQREYQLARRMGFLGDWTAMERLSMQQQYQIQQYEEQIPDGKAFEDILNQYMDYYI